MVLNWVCRVRRPGAQRQAGNRRAPASAAARPWPVPGSCRPICHARYERPRATARRNIAGDGLARRKADGVHHAIEAVAPGLGQTGKDGVDLRVLGDVARKDQRGAELGCHLGDTLFEAVAHIRERQVCALAPAGAGNAVGDGTIGYDSGDQNALAVRNAIEKVRQKICRAGGPADWRACAPVSEKVSAAPGAGARAQLCRARAPQLSRAGATQPYIREELATATGDGARVGAATGLALAGRAADSAAFLATLCGAAALGRATVRFSR